MLLVLHVLCLVTIFVAHIGAKIVPPTVIDSSTEYYIASTDEEFEDQQIICNTDICIIKCNEYRSCSNTTIDAAYSQNLSITCSEYDSCYKVNVISGPQQPSSIANIECSDKDSCSNANFNLQNIENVSISCNGSYACYAMLLNATNVQSIDINCKSTTECQQGTWDLSHVRSDNISCNSNSTTCAGVRSIGIPKHVICPPAVDCILDCVSAWISTGCKNGTIDGSQAVSLNVTCGGDYRCEYTNIICPINGDCNVQCDGGHSCQYAVINGNHSKSLSLACNNSDDYSCAYADVVCPLNGNDCYIQCLGKYSCRYIEIKAINTTNMSLTCNIGYSCDFAHITANYTDNLSLKCIEWDACRYIEWDSYLNAYINITGDGDKSIYYGNYIINAADYVDITCASSSIFGRDNNIGCYRASFSFNNTESVKLSCEDKTYDCYQLGIHGYTFTHSDDLHGKELHALSIFICVMAFVFVVIPIIGYGVCRVIKKQETNKPTISVLIYILLAHILIFFANWNLFARALAFYNTYLPYCNEKAMFICNVDKYCKIQSYGNGKNVDNWTECATDIMEDDVDCDCVPDQPPYYIIMAVFCSIGAIIEIVRVLSCDANGYKGNIDDSLLAHFIFVIKQPMLVRKLIDKKYNIRQYWNIKKNWSYLVTLLLCDLPTWITAIVVHLTYNGIEWYAIYPIIILFIVITIAKIRYRMQPVDVLPIDPTKTNNNTDRVPPVGNNDNALHQMNEMVNNEVDKKSMNKSKKVHHGNDNVDIPQTMVGNTTDSGQLYGVEKKMRADWSAESKKMHKNVESAHVNNSENTLNDSNNTNADGNHGNYAKKSHESYLSKEKHLINDDEEQNDDEYTTIKNILRECDDKEWERYLYNFKKHKINDKRLQFITNSDEHVWKELIPEFGVRFQFKALRVHKQNEEGSTYI